MGFFEANRNVSQRSKATEVIVTGTGIPGINPERAGAGVLVRHDDLALHFDAGRSTPTRVVEAGTDVADLDAIFLTHYHSDHVIGLDDFVLARWVEDDLGHAQPLAIVAPNGSTIRFCERVLRLWDDDLAVRAEHNGRSADPNATIVGFDVPDRLVEVWSKDDVRVLAGPVRHEPVIGAVGYRVETPDGVVAITGDTKVCPEVEVLARGADVVVYEAMRTPLVHALGPELDFVTEYHADTREIGAQMADLEIPTLLLTHLIPAPSDHAERQGFVDDVRAGGYRGTVIVCNDLDGVTLGPDT